MNVHDSAKENGTAELKSKLLLRWLRKTSLPVEWRPEEDVSTADWDRLDDDYHNNDNEMMMMTMMMLMITMINDDDDDDIDDENVIPFKINTWHS